MHVYRTKHIESQANDQALSINENVRVRRHTDDGRKTGAEDLGDLCVDERKVACDERRGLCRVEEQPVGDGDAHVREPERLQQHKVAGLKVLRVQPVVAPCNADDCGE